MNILEEEESIRKEIDDLKAFHVKVDENKSVEINCKLFLTVIDGKVLNVLTDTKFSQACPICATPKDFLSIKHFKSKQFKPKENNLKYGISPLHCWIRFFEFVLHVGYKIDIKKWQIRDEKDKKSSCRKKESNAR